MGPVMDCQSKQKEDNVHNLQPFQQTAASATETECQTLHQEDIPTYIGVTLDQRLTWKNHLQKNQARVKIRLTYLCPSLPVEHRPSTSPPPTPTPTPAITLCSGLLLSFRTSWSPAVSALLQCLASNCCKAGLSSSSPVGSRSGLGVWCWMLAS